MSVCIIVGTRPELIKMAPVIVELKKQGIDFYFIHSGQHYNYELNLIFIEELGLPPPDYNIKIGNHSQVDHMLHIIRGLKEFFQKEKDIILSLVQGDTNTTLAAAIASNKAKKYVGHIEAGLRSYDWRMPEEHNRRLTDHLSTFLFAPTELAKQNLLNENVMGHVYVTGNTVIDSVEKYLPIALKKSSIMEKIPFQDFALLTIHRAENVDNRFIASHLVKFMLRTPIPIVYPIHPRTQKMFKKFGFLDKIRKSPNIHLLPPVGYFDFLVLMKESMFILTDSGGIQEEATSPKIRKPVLILRWSTERPEAIKAGFAKIAGLMYFNIIKEINNLIERYEEIISSLPNESPFGDGNASRRIISILKNEMETLTLL